MSCGANENNVMDTILNCGIYHIINKVNGKRYVGQSKDIKTRWSWHRSYLRRNKHHNLYLQRSWNKYGEDAFFFLVTDVCEESDLCKIEQSYIDIKEVFVYNIKDEATRSFHSEEGLASISASVSESNKRRRGEGKGYYFNKTHQKFLVRRECDGKVKSKWCNTEEEAIHWAKKLLKEGE